MHKILFRIMKGIAQIIFVFMVIFVIYLGFAWWEIRQLNFFCAEVRAGVDISTLSALAEKYGFNRRWVERGVHENDSEYWVMFVPAASSMGEMVCAIRYKETAVVSAKIEQ